MMPAMKTTPNGCIRWLGVFTSLSIILLCLGSFLVKLYVPLCLEGLSLLDVIFVLVFFVTLSMSFWSFYRVSTMPPGRPPSWLREVPVEDFVRGVLRDILHHGTRTTLQEDVKLNLDERCVVEECREEPLEHDVLREIDSTNDKKPNGENGAHNECRRLEKAKGTQDASRCEFHYDVALAAADALEGMDRSRESFEHEMSFLLGGARFCRFCRIYKLDDTHHCSKCRTCVHGMDHHCPWIGQCVGLNNHKAFLLFLAYLLIACGMALLHTIIAAANDRIRFTEDGSTALFLLAIILAGAFFVVLATLLVQSVCTALYGESTLQSMQRNTRRRRYRHHQLFSNGTYSPLLEAGSAANVCRLSNLRRIFGVGSAFPWGLLPLQPQWPPAAKQEEMFWEVLRACVERHLNSVADAAMVDGTTADEGRDAGECAVPILS